MTLVAETQRMHGLPAEVTGFVGRERELAELGCLLTQARLVTVTGPGGVGKTRLALRAAAQKADRYPDGTCLAELSGLRDPELLASTVANALGLAETGRRNRLDAVAEYLRDRKLLLILDTCEHLVDTCAMFCDILLRATESVTVLATSRQPLDVPGEHVYAVAPLRDDDAVELFAQRAAAVDPGFTMDEARREKVASLCRRLDGVPLALELATVRLRALSLDQLASRLEDRFRLLTGGRRSALPHHQTLRTATEWSHDLCTLAERLLWARLSVFAGSFGISGAEEVCHGGELARDDVLNTLIGLVDKSVVLVAGEGRYRLLDTIREFGAEQLGAGADAAAVRERHLDRYVRLAEEFTSDFARDQRRRYQALRAEHDNIRAAIETGLALGRQDEAARLVSGLNGYWHISGLPREGRYWAGKLLERFDGPSAERAMLLITRCCLTVANEADGREGIALADQLGEPRLAAYGYLHLQLSLASGGRLAEAAAAGSAAAARFTALGDENGLFRLDAQMSQMHAVAGQPEAALARSEVGLRRADGDLWSFSYLHYTRGLALFQLGQFAQAAAAEHTALAMKAELGDQMGIGHCLEVLAWLAVATGRAERACWLLGAAGALWQRTGRRVSGNPFLEQFHLSAERSVGDALPADRAGLLARRGALVPLEQVVALAVADADDLPAPSGQSATPGSPGSPVRAGGLTGRENEIAVLVGHGLSNREIAERLVISKRTVDAHIEHIFAKIGVSSRVQLVTWLRAENPAE
jgi:predicted ATPase/DNA-binding CsgD family transcriptional regulator